MNHKLQTVLSQVLDSLSLATGDRLLVAVSGGGDSMALLHGLLSLQGRFGYRLTVASFDHLSREGKSTQERLAVEDYAKSHGCDFLWQSAPVETLARERKQSFELCARELRYAFFYDCVEKLGAKYLLTAHQAEDNVETLLYRLCRGTGLQGLSGIPPQEGCLLRPLLSVTREDIGDYLQENNIPHWTDQSNFDTSYRRNYIRHELLPLLEQLNPQYVTHFSNTMSIIREENHYLDKLVAEQVPLQPEDFGYSCQLEDLFALPKALEHRGLQRLVTAVDKNFRLTRVQGQQVLTLAKKIQPSLELLCCKHLRIEKIYGRMYCKSVCDPVADTVEQREEKVEKPLELCPNVKYLWGKYQITVETCDCVPREDTVSQWEQFTLPKTGKLFVRSRQQGDEIKLPKRPVKTLKKLMIEEKIPRTQREFLPVFSQEEGLVMAVFGLGIAEDFLPTEDYQGALWQIHVEAVGN